MDKSTQKTLFSSDSGEWETPNEIFLPLDEEFRFELDVCASHENHKCAEYFTIEDDCFTQSWVRNGWFWMNPPYGRILINFIRKAIQEVLRGAKGVILVPARTDTKWWSFFWSHKTHRPRLWVKEIRFIRGRVKFVGAKNAAPFPSAIIVLSTEKYRMTMMYHAMVKHGFFSEE